MHALVYFQNDMKDASMYQIFSIPYAKKAYEMKSDVLDVALRSHLAQN